ncbi:MAG: AAA family ATPase [Candidatus Muirbacterium halophilum]|nr:AAA family ATPase [Candidatus Muirbacterium halophilum]MCK9474808.1 AAA family ATPase [Candidatus Muirbacterium halophilum]
MEDEKKKELALKLKGILEEYIENIHEIKDFFNLEIKEKKDEIKLIIDLDSPFIEDINVLFSSVIDDFHIEEILKIFNDFLINIEVDRLDNLSINFLELLVEQFSTADHYKSVISTIKNYFNMKNEKEIVSNLQKDKSKFMTSYVHNYYSQLLEIKKYFENSLVYLINFSFFRYINKNFVIIGPNGSGKSTFSREVKRTMKLGNVTVIPAQKLFSYGGNYDSIPLKSNYGTQLQNRQNQDKLFKEERIDLNNYINDIDLIIKTMIEIDVKHRYQYYDNAMISRKEILKPDKNKNDMILDKWNSIIKHRNMIFDKNKIIINYNDKYYDFKNLSDGEKAIFYYIAHIILAKENSYIIVDEPENHLNLAIVNDLWDKLENIRSDCQFIYLTHNLDFASSRKNVVKLWNKEFTPPNKWNIQVIPETEELPEELLMELLGSRKKILFCEGTKGSLDYKLYSALFPDYFIQPVGGHLEVINYTKAFNKNKKLIGNSAVGIIDGDFHLESQIDKWKKDNIFTIQVQEVENLLCDNILLESAKEHFREEDDFVELVKSKIFKNLESDREKQATIYVREYVNSNIKSHLIDKKHDSLEGIKNAFNEIVERIDFEKLFEDRSEDFDNVIKNENYEEALKIYNNKGLPSLISKEISKTIKNYPETIIKHINSNEELKQEFKNKYFSEIPE